MPDTILTPDDTEQEYLDYRQHVQAHTQLRRRGEGVALDVVHVERELTEVVGAPDVLVGLVAAPVDAAERAAQRVGGVHGPPGSPRPAAGPP